MSCSRNHYLTSAYSAAKRTKRVECLVEWKKVEETVLLSRASCCNEKIDAWHEKIVSQPERRIFTQLNESIKAALGNKTAIRVFLTTERCSKHSHVLYSRTELNNCYDLKEYKCNWTMKYNVLTSNRYRRKKKNLFRSWCKKLSALLRLCYTSREFCREFSIAFAKLSTWCASLYRFS